MKPIGTNIVIKTIEEEIKTSSGLLLSSEDANQLRYKKGIIVKPGTDVTVISEEMKYIMIRGRDILCSSITNLIQSFLKMTLLLFYKLIHFYYHIAIHFIGV